MDEAFYYDDSYFCWGFGDIVLLHDGDDESI